MLRLIRAKFARKRLAATLRPDPEYRERRLAQFTTARRERYLDNIRKAGL
tara:strand:+ start:745 stop:894 length:150 start_codon:yes stop_codon:yes gene_type:complete